MKSVCFTSYKLPKAGTEDRKQALVLEGDNVVAAYSCFVGLPHENATVSC